MKLLRKIRPFIFLLLLIQPVYSQENLIQNGGFELGQNGAVPRNRSYYSGGGGQHEQFDKDIANWWNASLDPPCFFHPCPSSDWTDITTATNSEYPYHLRESPPSNRFVYFGEDEGIGIGIPSLKKGVTYTFRYKIQPQSTVAGEKNQIRVHLAEKATDWNDDWSDSYNVKQSDVAGKTFPADFDIKGNNYKWYSFEQHFKIDDNKDLRLHNLIIMVEKGSFSIDDVELFESGGCDGPFNIENKTYTYEEATYEANMIKAGYEVANPPLGSGDVIVKSIANVKYKAIQEVTLSPGFSVENGAEFRAWIAPCGADCFLPSAYAGADKSVCDNLPYPIGMAPQYGFSYTWSAIPASALGYLSNIKIANPNFTRPATGYGNIVYTLTVSNNCGQSASDNVIIGYDADKGKHGITNLSCTGTSNRLVADITVEKYTRSIKLELQTYDGKTTIKSYPILLAGIDFTPPYVHWTLPYYMDPCTSYNLWVLTDHYCAPVMIGMNYKWTPNPSISATIPDIFTPNGDGVNDQFCISQEGAMSYSIQIFNRYGGTLLYTNGGSVTSNTVCLWSGGNNSNGTYYYIVKLRNSCTTEVTKMGYVYRNGTQQRLSRHINEAENKELSTEVPEESIEAFPNPNEGSFKLVIPEKYVDSSKVYVYNILGKLIYQSESASVQYSDIDISGYSKGIYYVKVVSGDKIFVKKVIYQ